jgi:hypothetical protein
MLFFISECSTDRLHELMDHPAATFAVQDQIEAEINKRRQAQDDLNLTYEGKTITFKR